MQLCPLAVELCFFRLRQWISHPKKPLTRPNSADYSTLPRRDMDNILVPSQHALLQVILAYIFGTQWNSESIFASLTLSHLNLTFLILSTMLKQFEDWRFRCTLTKTGMPQSQSKSTQSWDMNAFTPGVVRCTGTLEQRLCWRPRVHCPLQPRSSKRIELYWKKVVTMTTGYSQQEDTSHQVSMRLKEFNYLKLLNVNIANAPF